MLADAEHAELHELDQRSGDGFEVTLLWSKRTGAVVVCVDDERTNTGFHVVVEPAHALDAFHHPYAYSRRRGSALLPTEWGAAAA